MPNTINDKAQKDKTFLVKVQRFGNFLSGMVMPNLGVFVAWGLITALFIPTGWIPNEHLGALVGPILTYLLPLLVGFTGGFIVHGQRGGAIGALATMGLIIGSSVTMLSGAMIMGPFAAWIMKKIDQYLDGKFRAGFEMLISNFSMGIVGLVITLAGYIIIGPIIAGLIHMLSAGVDWTIAHGLLPFISIFVAPAQVLFLNNAINHGIMAPLGLEQVAATGKSILFLVDANCGPSVGTLLAISFFGKGMAKKTAPTAALIAGVGGIGEVYFPFVLMKPVLVFATMGGITTSLTCFMLLGGGTVATPSPGSFFAMLVLTPKGAMLGNLVGFFAGMAVSFIIAAVLLKLDKRPETIDGTESLDTHSANNANANSEVLNTQGARNIEKIIVACDAGMGSSAMGASVLKTKLKKAMIDIKVANSKIEEIPSDTDLVITHIQLIDRAKKLHGDKGITFMSITNFIEGSQYDEIVEYIKNNKISR
ncbi:PTS system mannitol-specific transporter subunit IICBA [Yersinia frederiksenii]|nr:PTS system mannitol-specific transporter subunit IICBA [Yersinia frederiksenii]